MILNKIKEFFIKNKKEILFLSFFIIFIFSIGDSTFADEAGAAKNSANGTDGVSAIIEGMNFIIKIFSTLIGLLSALVSLLLNPGWVNGTIFGLDIYLKDIWILISNIVYFAFAFILIIIAFMNIIGKGGGTWELKSALPKFIIGVIMVPFTWFFIQFMLSISAFLTVSVLSLPYDVMADKDMFKEFGDKRICTEYTFDLQASDKTSKDSTKELQDCIEDESRSIKIADLLAGKTKNKTTSSSIYSIINIYTYGIMKIQDLTKLTKDQLAGVKKLADLTIKSIFDVLFIIVFLIIMIALFLALFVRGVWLWVYAMFSPVFGLLFFFGKSKEGVNKISPVEFIKLALVPVYVAAALSFGMIFLFVATQGLTDTKGGESIFKDEGNGVSSMQLGDFKIKLKGIQGGDSSNKNTITNSVGNGIGQLILEVFGLVILWIAVMAALKSSEITHNVVKPIISFGESIGSLVSKAPQYAPIIPTPGGGISAEGLNMIGGTAVTKAQEYGRKSGTDFMKKYSLFGNQADATEAVKKLESTISNHGIRYKQTTEQLGEAIDKYKRDPVKILADSNLMNSIHKVALEMGLINKKEKITDQTKLAQIIGKMEYNYENDSKWATYGQMFRNLSSKDRKNGFTPTQMKESYNKNYTNNQNTTNQAVNDAKNSQNAEKLKDASGKKEEKKKITGDGTDNPNGTDGGDSD